MLDIVIPYTVKDILGLCLDMFILGGFFGPAIMRVVFTTIERIFTRK